MSRRDAIQRPPIPTNSSHVEILSPFDLKIDGITIGNTSMIIWTKADGDEKPQPTFYDVKVTGDRGAIESQIKDLNSGDDITVQYAHDTVILSGAVAKEQTKGKIENIAKAFSGKIINNIEISDPKQVMLEIKVAQVDKNSLKSLGLSWILKGTTVKALPIWSVYHQADLPPAKQHQVPAAE